MERFTGVSMYEVTKELEISASHRLSLNYESKCENLHGHNWKIEVTCQSEALDENGMVIDFTKIKRTISEQLDHTDITEKICIDGVKVNPTAENIARWVSMQLGDKCIKVRVQESQGNTAVWKK